MSFFGFDPSLPRGRPHNQSAHGFGQAPDPFAGLSAQNYQDDDDALDFDETYEGYDRLGDQLEETDDYDNADTFGGLSAASGKNAGVSTGIPTMQPRQPLQQQSQQPFQFQQPRQRQQPFQFQQPPQQQAPPPVPKPETRPARSGYERYKDQDYMPKLEASASIWGPQPPRPSSGATQRRQEDPTSISAMSKKMMSLDEVEAMMRAQNTNAATQPPPPRHSSQPPFSQQPHQMPSRAPQIMQQPQPPPQSQSPFQPNNQYMQPGPAQSAGQYAPQILQRQQPMYSQGPPEPPFDQFRHSPAPPLQTQSPLHPIPAPQNAQIATMHRTTPPPAAVSQQQSRPVSMHGPGPSFSGPATVPRPGGLPPMPAPPPADLDQAAKEAKRNYKIHLLSKDNGLMTPSDKNFITRIQLSQLVTATGNIEEGPEAALAEDFYFQVFNQIRGPRDNQPLSQFVQNQFAQTYLNQTAGRGGNRRGFVRGGDQIRRMEQQVQRAVEAAKLKPKNKQLVIEGSLGKISFSNAKTPKPLLNLKAQDKRPDSAAKQRPVETVASRKTTLANIEGLYNTLMKMEDHERSMPPPTTEESSADEIQEQIDWRAKIQELNAALWAGLRVMEPIDQSKSTPHPFISILSHPKGKKIIPRIFRQIDDQQRLTILTMLVIHLDTLDVVRSAQPLPNDEALPFAVRNEVDLFSQAVMPVLFNYISEASLGVIIGLLGLIIERVNVAYVVRSKVGLGILTVFLSRAELLRHAGHMEPHEQQEFTDVYNSLFDLVEPHLPTVFTTPINNGDDMYVWQFLAALGTGATPDQQPRLVISVKDRVMDTVTLAKGMPEELGKPRLDNVNLFMRAIGLDVDLLG